MNRIETLISTLGIKGSAVLIKNPLNIRYFTGCPIDSGVLLICNDTPYFITDFRYIEFANQKLDGSDVNVVLQQNRHEQIKELLKKHNLSSLLIETEYQTVSSMKRYEKIVSIIEDNCLDDAISRLRMIKSEDEIENIRLAQNITDNAFSYILNYLKIGVTERDIALEIEMYMRKNGAEAISFDLIAVSGKNSSLPHGIPTEKTVEDGDFVTMDFGCKVNGYCCDMTRTVAIKHASDEMQKVYQTVLSAQTAAINAIKAGIRCSEIDLIARNIIDSAGYENCFGHSTGHGVGLYIHESPRLYKTETETLQSGMVVTVEPGIYLENKFGVRIEDLIVVTDSGYENLTKSEKKLIIV